MQQKLDPQAIQAFLNWAELYRGAGLMKLSLRNDSQRFIDAAEIAEMVRDFNDNAAHDRRLEDISIQHGFDMMRVRHTPWLVPLPRRVLLWIESVCMSCALAVRQLVRLTREY